MLDNTDLCAETAGLTDQIDVLSDMLGALRIRGSLLLHESYAEPWALNIPDNRTLGHTLGLQPHVRVVAFHYVQRGAIEVSLEDTSRHGIEAGELIVSFSGTAHCLSQGSIAEPLPVQHLLQGEPNPFQPDEKKSVRQTTLVCGVFLLHDVELNPMFAALPPLMKTTVSQTGHETNLADLLHRLSSELSNKNSGSRFVIERLLELLCAETLRYQLNPNLTASQSGWFKGLQDPVVARAIALIHANSGHPWSVSKLAQAISMSKSRFSARFKTVLGISPMLYVAQWRMNVAGRMLRESQTAVKTVAEQAGYDNLSAFNRAFKKHTGMTPARWRTRGD